MIGVRKWKGSIVLIKIFLIIILNETSIEIAIKERRNYEGYIL